MQNIQTTLFRSKFHTPRHHGAIEEIKTLDGICPNSSKADEEEKVVVGTVFNLEHSIKVIYLLILSILGCVRRKYFTTQCAYTS